jgi:hypothetical protein
VRTNSDLVLATWQD